MPKIYQENALGFFEKIYLRIKGKKDGKNGAFELKNGIFISPFIQNEIFGYNRFSSNMKQNLSEKITESIVSAKKSIDEIDIRPVDLVRQERQIEDRKRKIENDDVEELADLVARHQQILITDNARRTSYRNECRDNIIEIETLMRRFDDEAAVKKTHIRCRIAKYMEAAKKYYSPLPLEVTSIEDICKIFNITDTFDKERKKIAEFKAIINFDQDKEVHYK